MESPDLSTLLPHDSATILVPAAQRSDTPYIQVLSAPKLKSLYV